MSQSYTPDEVTFALYFDNELDHEEEVKFEAALNTDHDLLVRYNLWVETHERVYAHFESLEESYPLEGFTERVMAELPEQAPWTERATSESASQSMEAEESSWFKRFFIPILVGGLTAAAILLVLSRKDTLVSPQPEVNQPRPETQLIDHKVTWLESDEEGEDGDDSEDLDDEDEGI